MTRFLLSSALGALALSGIFGQDLSPAAGGMEGVVLGAATTILGVVPLIQDAFWISMALTMMFGLAVGIEQTDAELLRLSDFELHFSRHDLQRHRFAGLRLFLFLQLFLSFPQTSI